VDFPLDFRERKTQVLRKGTFGCLKDIPTVNVTMGCLMHCVYCYARGYPNAPRSGRVVLFSNLIKKLKRELSRKREKVPLVIFNTASDSFQPHPDIIDTSLALFEILLNRAVAISFLTKGVIPRRFYDIARDFPDLVSPRIGIVSLSEAYQRKFEPYAASPGERLKNIEQLQQIGITPSVRIDPVIPFVTDTSIDFETLFRRLSSHGIKQASLSYLHLRPAIHRQFVAELDASTNTLLEGVFSTRPWETIGSSTASKLILKEIRVRGYDRAREAADKFGVSVSVCSCKNPDIPGEICTESEIPKDRVTLASNRQRSLPFPSMREVRKTVSCSFKGSK
jgi:DNA repair photolyase